MAGLADFFKSLMGQQQSGIPFNQLVSGVAPEQQRFAQTDNLSPLEQFLAKQRMLQMRDQTDIRTIDPGKLWGGLDKNNLDAEQNMSDSLVRHLRQERI